MTAPSVPASDTPDPFAADTDPFGTPEVEAPEEFQGGEFLKLEEGKDAIFRVATWRFAFRHQNPFGVEPRVSSFTCAKDRTDRKNPVGDCIGCDAGLPASREVVFAVFDREDKDTAKVLNLRTGSSVYRAMTDMVNGENPDFRLPSLTSHNFKVITTEKGRRKDYAVRPGKNELPPFTEEERAAVMVILEKVVRITQPPEPGTAFYVQVSAELDEWVDAHPVKGHGKVPGSDGQSDF